MPPNNKDEWGQMWSRAWRTLETACKAQEAKQKRSWAQWLCLYKMSERGKSDWSLPAAVREGHGKWLLMAFLDSLVLLGILTHAKLVLYHPAIAPVLGTPFQDSRHLDYIVVLFAQPWKHNENNRAVYFRREFCIPYVTVQFLVFVICLNFYFDLFLISQN